MANHRDFPAEAAQRPQLTAGGVEIVIQDDFNNVDGVQVKIGARRQRVAPPEPHSVVAVHLPHPPQPPPPPPQPPLLPQPLPLPEESLGNILAQEMLSKP